MASLHQNVSRAFRNVKADITALQASIFDMNMKISELFIENERVKDDLKSALKSKAKARKTKKSRKNNRRKR